MDRTAKKNILLGFFVFIGIIIFITGIFLIGAKSEMFKKTFIVSARFSNATGLKSGSNIRYNGVKVGIVKAVNLINDTLVQVDMRIEEEKRHFIPSGAIVSIASDGLMGDKIINITAGKSGHEPVKDNEMLVAHNPINTDRVLETLTQSNENIKVITENLKILTTDINAGNGTIQSLYKDTGMAFSLKQSFKNLDVITGKVLKVSSTLQDITAEIQNGNGSLSKIINDSSLAKNLYYTMDKLKETSNELVTASGNLNKAIDQANNGKGAVNMLLTDTSFSSSIQQSMLNIKSASKGLDENMEALKHSFLTRGYFRKQAKKARQSTEK
jgi:phospholipid/cholesterol/gamma-HCH transport system substrate-binding protein